MARQRTPSAVDAFMQSYSTRYKDNEQKAKDIAEALKSDGVVVDDALVENIRQQLAMKGDFTLRTGEQEEAGAVAPVDPTLPQMSAISAEDAYDSAGRSISDFLSDQGAGFRAGAREGLAALLEAPAGVYNAVASNPVSGIGALAAAGVLPERVSNPELLTEEAKRLRGDAEQIRASELSTAARLSGGVIDEAEGFIGTIGALARNPGAAADMLSTQVGQMMSTLAGGGPQGMLLLGALQAGSMNAADVRKMAEQKGWDADKVAEAENLAFTVSAGANYLIPRAMQRQGGMAIEEMLTGAASRVAANRVTATTATRAAARPVVGEGLSEMAAETVDQLAQNIALEEPLSTNLGKSSALGLALGSSMGTAASPGAVSRNTAEWQQLEARARVQSQLGELERALTGTSRVTPPAQEVVQDNTPLSPEEAFAVRERQLAEEKARQEEEAFAQIDESNARRLREEELKRAAEANKTSPLAQQLAGIGAAIKPAPQPQPTVDLEQEVAEAPVDPRREVAAAEAASLLEAQNKRAAKEEADRLAAYKKEYTARRKTETERLANETRSIQDPTERTNAVVEGILAWDSANPEPTTVPEGWQPSKKPAAKRGRREVTPAVTPVAPTTPRPAGDRDARIQQLADRMGLEMRDGKTPTPKNKSDAQTIISDLVKKGTNEAAQVLNVMGQGKLSVVPNASSINIDGNEDSAAMFVPEDGKMYLFSDKVRKGDAVGSIIKAFHEATHAGQFNSREGRSSVMQQIMGKDKATSAEAKIRAAAKKGNKLAKRAVAKATKAAEAEAAVNGRERGDVVGQLEVMPYFVGEVMASRATTFGSLGGIVRDMKAGARNMVRTATGMDLDVNLDDIYAATRDVVQEIAQTDLKPTEGNFMNMLLGEQAVNFEVNKLQGRTYKNETGHEMFIIPDNEAELLPDATEKLLKRATFDPVPLGSLMKHDRLYQEMPEAKDISVFVDDKTKAWGYYIFSDDAIGLSSAVVNGTAKGGAGILETLLHEVQHWVQDKQGRIGETFVDKYTKEERRWINDAKEVETKLNSDAADFMKTHAASVAKFIPRPAKAQVMKAIMDKDVSDTIKAFWVVNNTDMDALADLGPDNAALAADNLKNVMEQFKDAQYKAKVAHNNKRKRYISNITEKEAFYTQANINTPADQLPVNPETDPRFGTEAYAKGDKKRTGLAMADEVDADAEADADSEVTKRWVPAVLTGLFRADRGLSKEHNAIIEYAITSPAGKRMEAEAVMGRYDRALRDIANEEGKTVDEVSKEVEAALEAVQYTESWDGNIDALESAMRPFGEAGEAIMEFRRIADELSLIMLEQRALDPRQLTRAEKAVYSKIKANLGKYTHRMYAAHTGELGKTYANAVWGDYKKVKEMRAADPDAVGSDAQEANYKLVSDAMDVIIEDSLLIPSDSKLARMKAEKVNRLYSTYRGSKGRTEGIDIDTKRDELAAIRDKVNGNTDAMTKTAEKLAKDLLGLADSKHPISNYYRGGREDTSILKTKEDIPKAIRKLMGEITEPGLKFVTTISKQAQFLAANKMLLELGDAMGGDILPPGSATPDNWTMLTGETFGPLEGYSVSPNMYMAIGDVQQQIATFEQMVGMAGQDPRSLSNRIAAEVAKQYGNLAATSKMLQIIYNPANLAFNFAGGFGTMLTNGNFDPTTLAAAVSDAAALVRYAANPTDVTDSIRDLVQFDIVDSAFVGEIKNDQYRALSEEVRKMAGRGRSETAASIISKLHGLKAGWKETYAMMDVVFKIANYKAEVAHLQKYYDALGEARTDEQIKREAADVVKRTNFTFRRVAPILKSLEAGGLTAFGPYMHEVFRTQIASTMQGVKEIMDANAIADTNPEAASIKRWRGARRLIGQAAYMGIAVAGMLALARIEFGDDPEEEKYLRSLLGDRFGDQDFIRVGTDEAGYPVLMAWSRTDAYGPMTDIVRAAVNTGASPKEVMEKAMGVYIMPRIVPQMLKFVKTAADRGERVSRTPLVQQLFPEAYSEVIMDGARAVGIDPRIAKAATNLVEAVWAPGVTTSWRDTNARPAGDSAVDTTFRALSYGGFNFQSLNPAKPVRFGTMDYAEAIKYGRRDLKDFLLENPNRTEGELTAEILRQRRMEREAYDDLRDLYRGALLVGMSKREAMGYMKSAQLSAQGINAVVNGRFVSQVINKASLQSSMQQELAAAPRSEHAEIKAKWKNIETLLTRAERNIN